MQEHPPQLGRFDEEVAQYRPISRMAIMGLLSGLASILALAHPVLWIVPPLALLFCWWGLRNIRASEGAMVGRGAAIAGILLAVFFSASALSNFGISRVMAQRQAKQIADQWIQFVKDGAIQHAHQWTLPYVSRESPGVPLSGYYESEDGSKAFAGFTKEDPGLSLSQVTPADKIEELGCTDVALTRSNRFVTFAYRLIREQQEPLEFRLLVRRFTEQDTGQHRWTVRPFLTADEEDSNS